MSTATVDQIGRDFASWLATVQRGETVAILDGGKEVARLVPPEGPSSASSRASLSMAEWLANQDEQMRRTFGDRTVADSTAVSDELRSDRR